MENWHGQTFEKPLTRVKETTQLVRAMLDGEKTDFDGKTVSSHGYRQLPLEPGTVPIYMAALRAKMLEAAAEFSDGVIINLFTLSALPKLMEHIRIGCERAGKKIEDMEIVCRHQVIVTEDKEKAREALKKQFTPYYATPVYNNFLAWCGEAAKMIAKVGPERSTTAAAGDRLIDEIAVIVALDVTQESVTTCRVPHIISVSTWQSATNKRCR